MAKPKPTAQTLLARANALPDCKRVPSFLDKHPLRDQIIACLKTDVPLHKLEQALREEGYPLAARRMQRYRKQIKDGELT